MTPLTNLERFGTTLKKAKERILIQQAKWEELTRLLREAEARKQRIVKQQDVFNQARTLLQQSAEHARTQAKIQMETLVTNALQFVFGPQFRFEIELADHGGKPVAEFYVLSDWMGASVRAKPQEARGGGVVDITSLALRIALLETFHPHPQGPLVLDEPGKHVSSEYIGAMLEFLKETGRMFERQILLVSHNTHLIEGSDRAFEITLKNGETQVNIQRKLDN